MNVFVASSVCWTISTSWWTSAPALPGSWSTRRSTIWAWSTMLVRLWAGPSCIARAISRRRSSWASRNRRDTAGGWDAVVGRSPPRADRAACVALTSPNAASSIGVRRRAPRDSGRAPGACPRAPRPATPSGRRAWSAATSCALSSAARSGSASHQTDPLRAPRRALSAAGNPPRLVPGGLGPGLRDEQVDLAELDVEARQLVRHPRRDLGQAGGRRGRRRCRSSSARSSALASVVVAISPPASGSSPGASRTRRPGSGR